MAKKSKKTASKKKTARKKQSPSAKEAKGSAAKVKSTKKRVKRSAGASSKATNISSDKKRKSVAGGSKGRRRARSVKTQLKPKDLEHFRQLLLEKLQEILGDVDWIENESLRKSRLDSTGDLSTMPIHMADLGSDNYEQEFSLGLMDSERKLVREILEALKRIAMGTYGICEGTGKPIPRARLEANPWARYCVEYASLIEQGKASEGTFYNSYGEDREDEEDLEEDMEDLDTDEDDDIDVFSYGDEEEEEEEDEEEGLYYEVDHDKEEDEFY